MSATRKIKGLLFTGVILSAAYGLTAAADTPVPRPAVVVPKAETILSSVDAPLSAVVVMGHRQRSAEREIWMSRSSASSCAFSPGSVDELYREAMVHIGANVPSDSDLAASRSYMSARSPSFFSPMWQEQQFFRYRADFPSEMLSSSVFGYGYGGLSPFYGSSFGWYDDYRLSPTRGCSQSDYNFAAGRARIARRDKTLPQAYTLYDQGKYAEALPLFEQAYAKLPDNDGGIDAALMIGRIYIERAADPADAPSAIYWLKKAGGSKLIFRTYFNPSDPYGAILPAAEASAMLGKIYLVGYGVPRDTPEAIRWFKRAGQQGHVPAYKILGDIYYSGYGIPRDVSRAMRYYESAAKEGFAPAIVSLGEIAYYGVDGRKPNIDKAVAFYNRAARAGDANALYALAYAYDAGESVAHDPQAAVGLYKAAALKGNAQAQGAMGTYFYKGEIVGQDLAIARKWFEVAAIGGDPDAMFNLAVMMSKGEGGEKDMAKAYAWMNIAKAGGHPRAGEAMAVLDGRMNVADRRAAEALIRPRVAD